MESFELKRRTFQAVIWAIVRIGASNILGFVLFALLARLLSPHDFGLFALSMVVVDIARVLATAGLSDAVIRDQHGDDTLATTAFWANLALGCIVGGTAWMLAPLYADLIGQPEISGILRCLAALVPVSALGGIHTARKLREFGHKAIAARTIGSNAAGGALAVIAAVAGAGVWSLVVQAAVVEAVGVGFAWQSYPWWPRLRVDLPRLAAVSSFSGTMMMTQLAGLLLSRIQDIVIGRYISVSAVGNYRIAWRIIDLIAQTTIQPIVSVSFVALARLQEDRERFRNALLRMLGLGAILTFPALSGFAVLSSDAIVFLFGPRWGPSADIAKVLTLMAVPFCMNLLLFSALAAIGRPGPIALSTTLQTVAALVLSLLAAPFGVLWMAAAYVLRSYLTMPYHLALFKRETGIGVVAMTRAIMPPFLASLAMALLLTAVAPLLRNVLGQGLVFLIVAVSLGGIMFLASLQLFAAEYLRSNIRFLLPLWRKQKSAVGTQ